MPIFPHTVQQNVDRKMSVNHDLPTIIHSHVLTVQQYSITCVYMYAACADYCKLENFEKLCLSVMQ